MVTMTDAILLYLSKNLGIDRAMTLTKQLYAWQQATWSDCLTDTAFKFRIFFDATIYNLFTYTQFMLSICRLIAKFGLSIVPYVTPVFNAVRREWDQLPLWHKTVCGLIVATSAGLYKLYHNTQVQKARTWICHRISFLKNLTLNSSFMFGIISVYALLRLTFSSSVVAVLLHYTTLFTLILSTWNAITSYNNTSWYESCRRDEEELKRRYDLSMNIYSLLETWIIIATFDLAYNSSIKLMSNLCFWLDIKVQKRSVYSIVSLNSTSISSEGFSKAPLIDFFGLTFSPVDLIEHIADIHVGIHDLFVVFLLMAHLAKIEIFTTKLRGALATAFNSALTTLFGVEVQVLQDDSIGRSPSSSNRRAMRRKEEWRRVVEYGGHSLVLQKNEGIQIPSWIQQISRYYVDSMVYLLPSSWATLMMDTIQVINNWSTYAPHIVCIILPSFLIRLIHPVATILVPGFKGLQALNRWDLLYAEFWLTQILACQLSEFVFCILLATHPNMWFATRMRFIISGVCAVVLRDPMRHMNNTIDGGRILMEGINRTLSPRPSFEPSAKEIELPPTALSVGSVSSMEELSAIDSAQPGESIDQDEDDMEAPVTRSSRLNIVTVSDEGTLYVQSDSMVSDSMTCNNLSNCNDSPVDRVACSGHGVDYDDSTPAITTSTAPDKPSATKAGEHAQQRMARINQLLASLDKSREIQTPSELGTSYTSTTNAVQDTTAQPVIPTINLPTRVSTSDHAECSRQRSWMPNKMKTISEDSSDLSSSDCEATGHYDTRNTESECAMIVTTKGGLDSDEDPTIHEVDSADVIPAALYTISQEDPESLEPIRPSTADTLRRLNELLARVAPSSP